MFNKIIYNLCSLCSNSTIMEIVNNFKNTRIQEYIYTLYYNTDVFTDLFKYCLQNYTLLNHNHYNRNCDIDDINQYSIIPGYIDATKSRTEIIYDCLKNILDKKIIYSSRLNKTITIDDCVVCDFFLSGSTKFKYFHTDLEYDVFNASAFNVWYLIENNNDYGNMFLLETPEYKQAYTPCFLNDDTMNLNKNTYLHSVSGYKVPIAQLDINAAEIKYLNMKNAECLVMSKHLLHRTDIRRDTKTFKGFNFRVLIRNKDGSIDFKGTPPLKINHHVISDNKIYYVGMFDFI